MGPKKKRQKFKKAPFVYGFLSNLDFKSSLVVKFLQANSTWIQDNPPRLQIKKNVKIHKANETGASVIDLINKLVEESSPSFLKFLATKHKCAIERESTMAMALKQLTAKSVKER